MDRMRKNPTLSGVCKKRLIEQICSTKFSLVSPEEEINHTVVLRDRLYVAQSINTKGNNYIFSDD